MYLKWLLFAAIVVNLVMKTEQQEHVYLWKITHPDRAKPSYLFGMLYLPWKILFKRFPSNVENIIKNVDVVENELKIAKELLWAVTGANNKKWILKMNEWMKEQKPKKWIQRMNEWMMELNNENTEEKSFFFAVGLGALITEHGSLIELLTNEGYKVEKMNDTTISSNATNGEAFDDDESAKKDNQQPEDPNGPYFLFV
uniref:Metalloprotease TIKI homolog n=1 Tax=Globodera pallida TaxID=36090 RepID=A0A183BNV0_GLOPA